MSVTGTYSNDAMLRQISEAVRIRTTFLNQLETVRMNGTIYTFPVSPWRPSSETKNITQHAVEDCENSDQVLYRRN